MSGAIATAAIIGGGIGAAGGLGSAALQSHAANEAAQTQANAADQAAQLQYQASQNALDFQKQQYATAQQEMAPWLNMGAGALGNLGYLMGIGPQPGAVPALQNQSNFGGPLNGVGASLAQPGGGPSPISSPSLSGSASGPGVSLPGGTVAPPSGFNTGGQRGGGGISGVAPTAVPALRFGSTGPIQAPSVGSPGTPQLPAGVNLNQAPNTSLGGFGSLMQPYPGQFQAPTGLTMENDPGYQARLQLGTDALQRSAAARGGLLTGATARDLNSYAQDFASNEYNNVYNRAFNQYAQNYNQYNQGQANQFNRLAALAGVGQTAASQLGYLGNSASQGITSDLLGTAADIGQQYNNAAAATASGYVGGANAWGNALGGIGGNLSQLMMMQQMNQANPYQTLYNAQQYPSAADMPQVQY